MSEIWEFGSFYKTQSMFAAPNIELGYSDWLVLSDSNRKRVLPIKTSKRNTQKDGIVII